MLKRVVLAAAGAGMVMLFAQQCGYGSASLADTGPSAFYPAPEQESASIVTVTDGDGRLHMAHTGWDGKTKDFIYYGVCKGPTCTTSRDGWKFATIPFARATKVQLAVTGDGRPRLHVIAYSAPELSQYNRSYSYGECEDDCTDPENWRFAEVALSGDSLLSDVLNARVPERTFALTADGWPRFIFTDANYIIEPDHYGAFLMSCEADCIDKANWKETNLAIQLDGGYPTERFTRPVLAVAPDGTTGVLANVYAFDEQGKDLKQGLYFYSCRQGCDDRKAWTRTFILETGGGSIPGPSWDLAFTRDSQPRIAQFLGDGMPEDRQILAHQLIYIYCKSACEKEDSWFANPVNPGKGIGEGADLVLDDADRPRIAMVTADGQVAIARCDEDCETKEPKWKAELVEPISVPEKERPQALPFHCDGEVWNARMPSLTLVEGRAVVGYDIVVSARCFYKHFQEPVPSFTFHDIFHGSRVASLPLAGES